MPGAGSGPRDIRLIRFFFHLGVYILLEETGHKERNEITIIAVSAMQEGGSHRQGRPL